MLKCFFVALIPGLKWALIEVMFVALLIFLWTSVAWFLGTLLNRFIAIPATNYIAFGSVAIIALVVSQIFFASFLLWVIAAWKRAKEIYKGGEK